MREELINFETAKLAKEKGFNIPCNKMFTYGREMFGYVNVVKEFNGDKHECSQEPHNWNETKEVTSTKYFSRPNQSLLQKWLRDVHGLLITIEYTLQYDKYGYSFFIKNKELIFLTWSMEHAKHETYEQALETGLQEALKKINL